MNIRYIERLETIDNLIKIKGTGAPKELAKRLGISESRLYEYISLMKSLGAPISYSRHRKSYYYSIEGGFDFRFRSLEKN